MGSSCARQKKEAQKKEGLEPKIIQKSSNDYYTELRMKAKGMMKKLGSLEKDKQKNIRDAKNSLNKGDEKGAELFVENASRLELEKIQSMRISHQLEALAEALKVNENKKIMMDHINKLTPILESQEREMKLDEIMRQIDVFNNAMNSVSVIGRQFENVMKPIGAGMASNVNFEFLPL